MSDPTDQDDWIAVFCLCMQDAGRDAGGLARLAALEMLRLHGIEFDPAIAAKIWLRRQSNLELKPPKDHG